MSSVAESEGGDPRCPKCGNLLSPETHHTCPADSDAPPTVRAPVVTGPDSETAPQGRPDATTVGAGDRRNRPSGVILGTMLNNKYQVLEMLGRGGMGAVYKARHIALDTMVAIKVLLRSEDEADQRRFLSEARLASKVKHPNTVYIADFGVLPDGRAFLEMEYLDGRPLAQEIARGPLEPKRACRIAIQIARGLQAVHDKGVIHRDLKPDNIFLLEQDGNHDFVKIVDFGIAKVARRVVTPRSDPNRQGPSSSPEIGGGDQGPRSEPPHSDPPRSDPHVKGSRQTVAGVVMGTPEYMAPEQALGEKLDVRVDQYALGCLLYEMLAGELPFKAADARSIIAKHITAPVQPLRERVPRAGVTPTLDALVQRLLEKEAARRFVSMRAVEEALNKELISTGGTEVPRGSLPRRLRRARWPLVLGIGGLLLGSLGSYVAYRLLQPSAVTEAAMGRDEATALRKLARTVLTEQLRSDSPELRAGAAAALGQSRDVEVRSQLMTALSDRAPAVQAAAATALGTLGDRQAAAGLRQGLASDSPQVRLALAESLRQLGDARGQEILLQALGEKDAEAQLRAALLLCEQGPDSARRVLRAYSERPNLPEQTLLSALVCLARSGDAQARQRLTQQAASGPQERRIAAATKLAQLGDATALDALRAQLRRRGPEQLLAARALASVDEADGLPRLRQVAADEGAAPPLRILALDGLGAIGESSDARRLGAELQRGGSEPQLRQALARALVQILARDPSLLSTQSLSWAQAAFGDGDALARASAAAVLGDIEGSGAAPLLANLLDDSAPEVRRSAARALGQRGDLTAVAALEKKTRDADAGVRQESLRALARLAGVLAAQARPDGVQRAKAWFAEALARGTEVEKALAASALAKLGDPSQIAEIKRLRGAADNDVRRTVIELAPLSRDELALALGDEAEGVRQAAARRLAQEGDRRATPVLREAATRAQDPEQRAAAARAAGGLPAEQALPLLDEAARDREAVVRRAAASGAAALGPAREGQPAAGEPVLRRLLADIDASVRAQAAALFARVRGGASPEAAPRPVPTPPALPVDAGTPTTPTPRDAGADAGPGAGPTGGTADPEVRLGRPALSGPEQMAQAGLESLARKDYRRAQSQLEKAAAMCSRDKAHADQCGPLLFELHSRLGEVFLLQQQMPRAMTEYQRAAALSGSVKGKADLKAITQAAIAKLSPQLGRVQLSKRVGKKCRVETEWLLPGTHYRTVGKKLEPIEVKAGQETRVGSCD